MSRLGRAAGLASAAAGLVAVGVAAGTVVERRLVHRRIGAAARSAGPSATVPLGQLRGPARTVRTADGISLHVEVDDAGATDAVPVVFVHGYALNLDSWHFQRLALRDSRRLVFYDQRSHGRSERSDGERSTIAQLGEDLRRVIEETVPEGPFALVGHSMGGMTIMALAELEPALFSRRVGAVALLGTSAGDLGEVTLGLPGVAGRVLRRLAPGAVALAARAPRLAETGRRAGSDLGYLLTARLAFGGDVAPELVAFVDEMLARTPVTVVADFLPDFAMHERHAALGAAREVPTLVLSGTKDVITPPHHSRLIAEQLPSAELVEMPGAGHMLQLERPAEVNRLLDDLLRRCDKEAQE